MTVLPRGAVVVRDRRFGVVWQDDGSSLSLLPILSSDSTFRHDILLELSDLIACGTPIVHAVLRPRPIKASRSGQETVGIAPGSLMCRVTQALVRITIEQQFADRWAGDRSHRNRARKNACA